MPHYQRYLLVITLLLGFFSYGNQVQASAPANFGQDYSLLVHSQNQDTTIPRLKGVQILKSYFPKSDLKIDNGIPASFMSQKEFLVLFERMRLDSEGKLSKLSDDELYTRVWLELRRKNLLPETRLTYHALQEFLYRYEVSKKHGDRPYSEGLVLDISEINPERFQSLYGVREIKGELFKKVLNLKTLGVLGKPDKVFLDQVSGYYEAFKNLEEELRVLRHPFSQIPDMPGEMKEVISQNNLNEVLGSITYNYSSNNANRKHNLITGTERMNGKLYQPGDLIDFTQELGSDGWSMYKYGWVIFGGEEQWQFGGGLCGSATMAFTPSWKAGLEIVKRYSHSIYYKDLYPEESFGLDATIYRGVKNLVMRNSTDDPILFYVEDDPETQEIKLYLIGNAPYYNIEVEGPIEVGRNTYKWVRRMTQFDGKIVEDELTTHYGLVH